VTSNSDIAHSNVCILTTILVEDGTRGMVCVIHVGFCFVLFCNKWHDEEASYYYDIISFQTHQLLQSTVTTAFILQQNGPAALSAAFELVNFSAYDHSQILKFHL